MADSSRLAAPSQDRIATAAPAPPAPPQPPFVSRSAAPSVSGSTRSRRGSFSFLRRSKSREDSRAPSSSHNNNNNSSSNATTSNNGGGVSGGGSGTSFGSRLFGGGRRRKSVSAEQAPSSAKRQQQQQQQIPRLPSQLLPNISNGAPAPASAQNSLSSHPAGGARARQQTSSSSTSFQPNSPGYPPSSYDPPLQYPQYPNSLHNSQQAPRAFQQRYHMANQTPSAANVPVPPAPANGSHVSPTVAAIANSSEGHSRNESMTNRGRYSYGSYTSSLPGSYVNSPRRVRRRRDPTPFNVLVLGTKNCGKTSFIEFLRTALAQPLKQRYPPSSPPQTASSKPDATSSFNSHFLETELDGERIGLTLYDSKGLERHIVDLQLREISSFLESKFQETFNEEQKVLRATGVRDTHIHCVFLILDPARLDLNIAAAKGVAATERLAEPPRIIGGLDERLDVSLLQTLQGKTTVIPIISKADTITTAHMSALKRIVWDSFKKIKFDPLDVLNVADDDESDYATASGSVVADSDDDDNASSAYGGSRNGDVIDKLTDRTRQVDIRSTPTVKVDRAGGSTSAYTSAPQHPDIRHSTMSENVDLPYLPLSIISPDVYEPGVIGRRFPWGFADPYNTDHCDFVKLKENVFSEWRAELREAARERWYENWRTSRLKRRGHQTTGPVASRGINAGRSVSGGPAYTGTANLPPVASQNRIMSTNQIGLAVSNDVSSSAGSPRARAGY